jgi:beta-aspartyl-peptidase (threonine type)
MSMGRIAWVLAWALVWALPASWAQAQGKKKAVLVIHGGAGTILKENMTPELEEAYRQALSAALDSGFAVLQAGGPSLDAVEAAILVMENSPLFNAGKGAVLTHDGRHELDAAVMDGATRQCGAVAGITVVKNPIRAARAVMERSPHVLMAGKGAEEFAREQGLELVDNRYFLTEKRLEQLRKAQEPATPGRGDAGWEERFRKFGTVGAVALDRKGNLAAGTSTGGMTNKRYGRIGDSPLIGAGTYADNATCAVSCTGHGEYFIRAMAAYDIAARMAYRGESVEKAANRVILKEIPALGGSGGAIALDRKGRFAMPFSTPGMYRAVIWEDGSREILIYR